MSADPVSAQNAASASLARAASGQAFTLAFSDTLIVTAAIMLLGAIFVWALPALPPEPDSPLPHPAPPARSEEHTSELTSLMRNSYALSCFKKKQKYPYDCTQHHTTYVPRMYE